jgi:hypothetical protein
MTWNNNDREESKPTWLNPSQKINCVRTVKGWEIPLHGTSLGANYDGLKLYNGAGFGGTGMTNSVPHMELIVAMPLDPSPTGVTNTLYAERIVATGGATSGQGWNGDAPNYRPYITCPFNGDSATAGGFDSTGLSFGSTGAFAGFTGTAIAGMTGFGFYAVNGYGVSTLNFPGATAYIKIVANDSNFTQNLTFSLPANTATNPQQFGATARLVTGTNLVDGTIPFAVYQTFFGPTASVNNNIAVLQIARSGATANTNVKATVLVTDNGVGGLTGISTFQVSFGAAANA